MGDFATGSPEDMLKEYRRISDEAKEAGNLRVDNTVREFHNLSRTDQLELLLHTTIHTNMAIAKIMTSLEMLALAGILGTVSVEPSGTPPGETVQ